MKKILSILLLMNSVGFSFAMDSNIVPIDPDFPLREQLLRRVYQLENLERRPMRNGGMFHINEKNEILHDTTGLYASQKQVENLGNLEEDLERRPVRNGGGMFHFDEHDIQLYDSTDGLDFVGNKQ